MSSNINYYQTIVRLIDNLSILMNGFVNVTPFLIGRVLRANQFKELRDFKQNDIMRASMNIYFSFFNTSQSEEISRPLAGVVLKQIRTGFYSELERFIHISPVVVGNTVTCQFGSPGDDTMEYREYVEVEVLRIDETIYIVHDKENKIVGAATNPWKLLNCDNTGMLYCNNAAGYGKDSSGIFKECETIHDVLNHPRLFEYYN